MICTVAVTLLICSSIFDFGYVCLPLAVCVYTLRSDFARCVTFIRSRFAPFVVDLLTLFLHVVVFDSYWMGHAICLIYLIPVPVVRLLRLRCYDLFAFTAAVPIYFTMTLVGLHTFSFIYRHDLPLLGFTFVTSLHFTVTSLVVPVATTRSPHHV